MSRINRSKKLKKIFKKYTSWRIAFSKGEWKLYAFYLEQIKIENLDESDLKFLLKQVSIKETVFKERHTFTIYFSMLISIIGGLSIPSLINGMNIIKDDLPKHSTMIEIIDYLLDLNRGGKMILSSYSAICFILILFGIYSVYFKIKYRSIVTFKESLIATLNEISN
ncbi:hypothetical protein [Brevibacillus daliensis]|uniref:hypothetical protein n=1 Tax=Brevibacillus daliensis TaxID=2892995 RepID=UPI001E5420B8|nr:hypothetical protein [Brevibacillus daliensis]